jgi:glycosyltransferase involved in cell wall biosynthesis
MKVGIFLPEISPQRGGAFTFVETVLAGLADSPDSAVVFHYGSVGDLAKSFDPARIRFHCLAASAFGRTAKKVWYQSIAARLQGPLHMAAQVTGKAVPYPAGSPLDRAARAHEVDLMWFPTPMYEPVDLPYVVTIWDLEHRLHPYFPELAAQGEWQARERAFGDALRRATYVVTGTHVGRDEIIRFYAVDEQRIHILPHPTPKFALDAARAPAPALTVPIPTPFVLYPAQFWSHKNHVGLLAGVAELNKQGRVVHVALVGSDKGNLEHVRHKAAELGIADQVHFLGFVERDQLVALYRNAAALVYTSLCGPENLPPLEAMALGCPVINSDIAGAREQLGEAALLVDTLDAGALASAIARVLDSPDIQHELITKGKARAARYTQTEFGRDMQAVMDDFRRRRALWPQAR